MRKVQMNKMQVLTKKASPGALRLQEELRLKDFVLTKTVL